jgi:hypothetical protein
MNYINIVVLLALVYTAQAQKIFVTANGPSNNNALDSVLYSVNMANGKVEPLVEVFVQVNLGVVTDGLAAYDPNTMTYYSSDGFSNIYRVNMSSNTLQSTINFGFQNISSMNYDNNNQALFVGGYGLDNTANIIAIPNNKAAYARKIATLPSDYLYLFGTSDSGSNYYYISGQNVSEFSFNPDTKFFLNKIRIKNPTQIDAAQITCQQNLQVFPNYIFWDSKQSQLYGISLVYKNMGSSSFNIHSLSLDGNNCQFIKLNFPQQDPFVMAWAYDENTSSIYVALSLNSGGGSICQFNVHSGALVAPCTNVDLAIQTIRVVY